MPNVTITRTEVQGPIGSDFFCFLKDSENALHAVVFENDVAELVLPDGKTFMGIMFSGNSDSSQVDFEIQSPSGQQDKKAKMPKNRVTFLFRRFFQV